MKSFEQFWEDVRQLRQDLKTIDRQDAAERTLEARRRAAKSRADALAGTNDTEARLQAGHRSATERDARIRARFRSQRPEQSQRSQSSTAAAITQVAKKGLKLAGKATKKVINRIRNRNQSSP